MKHILLVDDDPGLRQLLLVTLAAPEFLIRQVSSGKMAEAATKVSGAPQHAPQAV